MTEDYRLKTNHASRIPLVILAVTLAAAFYRLLLGEVFFWGLPALQFVPWRQVAFDTLRAGTLPLWNPYAGAGAPLFANYQSALLYPFNWPGYVLPLAWQMSVAAVMHLFLAGWGMWRFTGRLGVPDLGRGLSALAWGLGSYLVARLGTYPTISAAAWLPWLLWAALGVTTRRRRRDLAWLALFAALQLLAGHAQTTWYSLLLVGCFVLWCSLIPLPLTGHLPRFESPSPSGRGVKAEKLRRAALVAGALLLGMGAAALQLLATGELLLSSQRSGGVDYDFAMNFSYAPSRLLNLLSPNVFGTPADGTYITEGAFFEDAIYIGLIPLVSALAAALLWVSRRLRRAERPAYNATVPFWMLVTGIGFLLALGKYSPLFPFLYLHIPTFDLFQAPVRWHLWTVFGLSVLAGIGVGAWGRGKWQLFWTRLITAACLGAVVLALAAPRLLPADVAENGGVRVIIQAVIFTGVLGALAGDLTLLQPEPGTRRHRWWSLAVLVVVALDLGLAARGLNPTAPAGFFDRRGETKASDLTAAPRNDAIRAYWPKDAQEAVMYRRFLPFDDYRTAAANWQDFRDSGLPNLNLLDRTPLLNNFDPLLIGHFADYLDLIEANPSQAEKLLAAARAGYVFDADGNRMDMDRAMRHPAVFPYWICWHDDDTSVKSALSDRAWMETFQVHLSGAGKCSPNPPLFKRAAEVLAWEITPNALAFNVRVEGDDYLYLPNTDYPGWVASVDGQPARILRANLAFMAVEVPAGAARVQLDYRPWWLLPGALISILSLLGIVILFRSKNPGWEA